MAGKIPALGDFNIPSEIFDLHEWMADELIDGDIGVTCTLTYPSKQSECTNCIYDRNTERSSNIYKTGGPEPFENYQTCPICQGRGRLELPQTEQIRLRVYYEDSEWRKVGVKAASPDTIAVVIGYMLDLPKLEKANTLLLNDELAETRNYLCARNGEARPHGFRENRYFIQELKRTGGG